MLILISGCRGISIQIPGARSIVEDWHLRPERKVAEIAGAEGDVVSVVFDTLIGKATVGVSKINSAIARRTSLFEEKGSLELGT
jgi:hypothetical protein